MFVFLIINTKIAQVHKAPAQLMNRQVQMVFDGRQVLMLQSRTFPLWQDVRHRQHFRHLHLSQS